MSQAILGLGSNISPDQNLPAALRRLALEVSILAVSSRWETTAVGSNGPAFLNAAVLVKTDLSSQTLKQQILARIETDLGRVRSADKNAPRTIDLDILVFEGVVFDENLFRLDHLILPVAEIAPELCEPGTEKSMRVLAKEHCCKPTAVCVGPLLY
jgi:2-amino-4-hydroxy-6-hydroxymethyldihydropteridine diphosphokinase